MKTILTIVENWKKEGLTDKLWKRFTERTYLSAMLKRNKIK